MNGPAHGPGYPGSGPFACAHADAVIAHFLDGAELGTLDYVAREELIEHLSSCPSCDAALSRARRLDAMLAAQGAAARAEPEPELVDEWFTQVFVEEQDAPATESDEVGPGAGSPIGGLGRSLWIAAAAAVLLALGYAVGRRGETVPVPRVAEGPADSAPGGPTAGADPVGQSPSGVSSPGEGERRGDSEPDLASADGGGETLGPSRPVVRSRDGVVEVRIDDDAASRPVRSGRRALDRIDLAAAVEHPLTPLLAQALSGVGHRLSGWTGDSAIAEDVDALIDRSFERTVRRLGEQRSRSAEDALFVLAVRDRLPAARDLLEGRMRTWLRRIPTDRRARRLAAEFGGRTADRALLDWAVGDLERSDEVSNHLRAIGDRDGSLAVLLELWRGLERRGDSFGLGGPGIADRWFSGRGEQCVDQVLAALEATSNSEQRERLVLACGALRSPRTSPVLIELLFDSNRSDSVLVAHALGRLPARSDDLLDLRVSARDLSLWRTVLASRRDPVCEPWIASLELTPEERSLLLAGGFSVEQIPTVRRLFEQLERSRPGRRGS